MSDISLLPDDLRGKEQAVQKGKPATVPAPAEAAGLKMHIPESTADEDIEIIEVDESDLGSILADEPLFTRVSYQLSAALDSLKEKFFASRTQAPPPKLPPQFFTPPKPGLVTKAPAAPGTPVVGGKPGAVPVIRPLGAPGGATTAAARSHARVTPQAEAPRRVRVIRRIRKPVHVSLMSVEDMLAYRADVPRRKWTLGIVSLLFVAFIAGGYILLRTRVVQAQVVLSSIQAQLDQTRTQVGDKEKEWSTYSDLQQRLTALDSLLNHHVILNRVFDFLERYTLPEVSYSNAAMSADGTLSLGVTATSFDAAARQLVAFQRAPWVLQSTTNAFTIEPGKGGVTFHLDVKLDPRYLHGPLADDSSTSTSATAPTTP